MTNRTEAPTIHNIQQIDYVKAKKSVLTNGIPVFHINGAELKVVKIDFIFKAGNWQQNENFIASFTANMLQEGTKNYTSETIAKRFDFYGSYIQIRTDQDFTTISIICLNKYLSEILNVTEDIIKRPTFPQKELEVLRAKQKQKFQTENEKVKVLCHKKFTTLLFGDDHPYAINNRIKHFSTITREKLLNFFLKCYHANNCRIIVSGNADNAVLALLENHFGKDDWTNKKRNNLEQNFTINPTSNSKYKITKKNTLQTAIRTGCIWVNKTHPDYCGLSILVTILGGYFGSRLMMNIREEKGYTYGIGAYVVALKNASYFVISTEVDNSHTDATLSEIEKEMKLLQNELISEEELKTVKSYLLGEFLRDFDGSFALADAFKAINNFGLDYSFYEHYLHIINTITAEELQKLACKYLQPEKMIKVLAGK